MTPGGLDHEFVDTIPESIEPNRLYISTEYATVVHLCMCGCGHEVVTPLTPTDWRILYDGETVSLSPSVGNWSFPCRSHYWIDHSTVRWAARWTSDQVDSGRAADRLRKEAYFEAGVHDTMSRLHRIKRWIAYMLVRDRS